jgi:hypothetical protein
MLMGKETTNRKHSTNNFLVVNRLLPDRNAMYFFFYIGLSHHAATQGQSAAIGALSYLFSLINWVHANFCMFPQYCDILRAELTKLQDM